MYLTVTCHLPLGCYAHSRMAVSCFMGGCKYAQAKTGTTRIWWAAHVLPFPEQAHGSSVNADLLRPRSSRQLHVLFQTAAHQDWGTES